MTDHVLVINFKSYPEALGSKGLRIARAAEKISEATGKHIIISPQTIDLRLITSKVSIPVFAQSISSQKQGPYTGWVTARSIVDAGVKGVLINHHEHKLAFNEIELQVNTCNRLGIASIVFAPDINFVRRVSMLKPDYVAFAPGGPVSTISNMPAVINQAFRLSSGTPLLVSGGISSSKDIKNALLSGASGAVVSSSVIKSNKFETVINNLVNAL